MKDKIRVAGLSFEHMHMGDNLAFAAAHPDVEVVALCDERPPRVLPVQERLGLSDVPVFTEWERCLQESRPDLVLLCPSTGEHALWVERVAPHGCHMIVEKPFASSLLDARRMIQAARAGGGELAINWPLAWYPPHVTAKRLVDEGLIGAICSVNYYDGNRGPLYHLDGKRETSESFRAEEKSQSWFYKKSMGGGSLLDYLGYGATLGTWFLGGEAPSDVTCVVDQPEGLEVDEHSITVARYSSGLCRFETRWGTFTDPWTHQPQPKCGFEIVGDRGTITSYDYEESVRVQTQECPQGAVLPVDAIEAPMQNPIQYMVHCLRTGQPVTGPLSPELSYTGQRIVDSALKSAAEGKTVELLS